MDRGKLAVPKRNRKTAHPCRDGHQLQAKQPSQIVSMAAAGETYAKEHNLSVEAYNYAAEIKLRATRTLGQILKEAPKNTGTAGTIIGPGRGKNGSTKTEPPFPQPPTLAESGLTKTTKQQSTKNSRHAI